MTRPEVDPGEAPERSETRDTTERRLEPSYDASAVLASLPELAARLEARQRERIDLGGFRRAAVLVPIVDGPEGPELLLTVRSTDLPHHAGQVAFPGGGLESGEDDVEAALRETFEEIGVRVEADAVVGLLDDHPSPARYVATPVVARFPRPATLRLDEREVGAWFAAPLAELARAPVHSELRVQPTFQRRIHWFEWRGRTIWGFTGNVVKNLLDVLAGRATQWRR